MAETPKTIPALKIRAVSPDGFFRAGRKWTKEPVVVPVRDFTKDQVVALRHEPSLVVEDTEIAPEPEA